MTLAALAGLGSPVASAGQAAPAAVVLQVDGTVRVIRQVRDSAGVSAAQVYRARAGTRLLAGDRVEPLDGGGVTVLDDAGQRARWDESVVLDSSAGEEAGVLFRSTVDVLDRALAGIGGARGNREGRVGPDPEVPTPIAPRNGSVIMEAQPRFHWFGVGDGVEYTVEIGADGEVPRRYTVPDTALVIPRALSPGRTYGWTVTAGAVASGDQTLTTGDQTSNRVFFRTISDAEATALIQGLAEFRALGFDPEGDGRLLKVVLFVDLNLLYAALAEIHALEAQSELGSDALRMKAWVLDRLGRLDRAGAVLAEADALAPLPGG